MNLKELVDKTIDAAIRGFDPQDRDSYDRWDLKLRHVEDSLRNTTSERDPLLLASLCAERIRIAFEAEKFHLVIRRTADYLRDFSATTPSFSFVASLRASALHAIGAHEEEVREVLQTATEPELRGSEYVYLLASLSERHPGCLPADEDLWQKLRQSIDDLRAQGYETLPQAVGGPMQLEEMAGRVADELRRVNKGRGEALLSEI